jgi:hypothetical protein
LVDFQVSRTTKKKIITELEEKSSGAQNQMTSNAPSFTETFVAVNFTLFRPLIISIFPPEPIIIFEPLAVSIVIVPDPADTPSIFKVAKSVLIILILGKVGKLGEAPAPHR